MWLHLRQRLRAQLEDIFSWGEGPKAVLIDKNTAGLLSTLYSLSNLASWGIHHVESLNILPGQRCRWSSCIVLFRVRNLNVELLMDELKRPRSENYYIVFIGSLSEEQFVQLTSSDKFFVVKEFRELLADFDFLHDQHLSLRNGQSAYNIDQYYSESFKSSLKSLLSVLGSEAVIRYDGSSRGCIAMAREISMYLLPQGGRKMIGSTSPTILILDRHSDLLTPLVTPWSYGALIYELFECRNSIIDLGGCLLDEIESSKAGSFQLSLQLDDDVFLRENFDKNFGEIGRNLQQILLSLREGSLGLDGCSPASIESMKKIIEDYPKQKRTESCAATHVRIAEAVSKYVHDLQLLQVSEIEQLIVTSPLERYTETLFSVQKSLMLLKSSHFLALKIVALLALRFKNSRQFSFNQLADLMRALSFSEKDITLVSHMLTLSLADFQTTTDQVSMHFLNGQGKFQFPGAVYLNDLDLENQYTRHVPPIIDIVDRLVHAKLSTDQYPIYGSGYLDVNRVQEILVLFLGGSTLSEASFLRRYNQLVPGISIILAGSDVFNGRKLIENFRTVANL